MKENGPEMLSGEEAGAIVAQWADQHPIRLDELVRRLEIEPGQVASLRRQAQGRLSMEKWIAGPRQPVDRPAKTILPPLLFIVAAVTVIGTCVVLLLHRPTRRSMDMFGPRLRLGAQAAGPVPIDMRIGGQTKDTGPPGLFIQANNPKAISDRESQAGSNIGAQIASETVRGGSLALISHRSSFDLKQPIKATGPKQGNSHVYYDETKEVLSQKLSIPDDLEVTISTPIANYSIRGQLALNPDSAARLVVEDIAKPTQALMGIVLRREAASRLTDLHSGFPTATIALRLGVTSIDAKIPWSKADQETFSTMFLSLHDPLYPRFITPFLYRIRSAKGRFSGGATPVAPKG